MSFFFLPPSASASSRSTHMYSESETCICVSVDSAECANGGLRACVCVYALGNENKEHEKHHAQCTPYMKKCIPLQPYDV